MLMVRRGVVVPRWSCWMVMTTGTRAWRVVVVPCWSCRVVVTTSTRANVHAGHLGRDPVAAAADVEGAELVLSGLNGRRTTAASVLDPQVLQCTVRRVAKDGVVGLDPEVAFRVMLADLSGDVATTPREGALAVPCANDRFPTAAAAAAAVWVVPRAVAVKDVERFVLFPVVVVTLEFAGWGALQYFAGMLGHKVEAQAPL